MLENMLCHQFEELLTDYLDGSLRGETHRAVASHALSCPVCHTLLNEVKASIHACHKAVAPKPSLDMEARILQMTMPETAMSCAEFEELLTDYLDGFLPASLFHRWEHHSSLCSHCTNLPGEVVRSIGACYTYKSDELSLPEGLHQRILQTTLGTTNAAKVKMSFVEHVKQKLENVFKPIYSPVLTPQFASVAMMLLMAFVVFSNMGSTDNSIGGVYQKGLQLAAQTYEESSNAVENGLNLNSSGVIPPTNNEGK
ncbi:MAG: zf-HC2 domain-containing protein, partial [Pyrinomonadaceae bacterium]